MPDMPRDATVVCEHKDAVEKYPGRRVVVCPDAVMLNEAWSDICRRYPAVVVHGGEDFHERADWLANATAANVGNTERRGRTWVEHVCEALPYLHEHPSAHALLETRYIGVPAFIVGAGSCLDEVRDLLPLLPRKGLTFAVNAGTQAIDAHIGLTNESNDQTQKTRPGDSLFVTGPQADPGVRRLAKRLAWAFSGELGEALAQVVDCPVTPCCASSPSLAFSLALAAGCEPIVLVGQDLSFGDGRLYSELTPDWQSGAPVDADGTVRYQWSDTSRAQDRRTSPLPEAEQSVMGRSVGGGEVPTLRSWHAYGRWCGHVARIAERRCVQTAPNWGLAIEGFEHVPLSSVLDGMPDRRVELPEVAPNLSAAAVEAWRGREREELQRVVDDPRRALTTTSVLLDAWAFRAVSQFLACRRSGAVGGVWQEYRQARLDRVKLDAVVRQSAAELLELL